MIYMLRGLYDLLCASFTGGWWLSTQEPLDLDPVPAEITEDDVAAEDFDDDDGTPLPPPTGLGRPICTSCGDPNFSLSDEICIACRSIGIPQPVVTSDD